MAESVYVETTIFSFYHDGRPAPAIVAMRDWTRQWWDHHRHRYEVLTSTAVLAELDTGSLPHRNEALAMAMGLPAIPVEDEIREIVDVYIRRRVMPNDPLGDALHLANANKFAHIRRVNTLLGLHMPMLVTPLELMGGE